LRTSRRGVSRRGKETQTRKMLKRAFTSSSFVNSIQTLYKSRNAMYADVLDKLHENKIFRDDGDMKATFQNDHMALRTFAVPSRGLGLEFIDRILRQHDYVPRDRYEFAEKKLRAQWYARPTPNVRDHFVPLPRLFVSELCVDALSAQSRSILEKCLARNSAVQRYLDGGDREGIENVIDAIDHRLYSTVPSREDYELLRAESEYGAWTLLNGHRVNHCTIPLHTFRTPHQDLNRFVPYARQHLQIPIIGNVQTSADRLLMQISTEPVRSHFLFNGDRDLTAINGSFIEFIERKRDGFEAQNADRIFETTDRKETEKEAQKNR
jgi:hypothetical protein